jgi:hypothetical protein
MPGCSSGLEGIAFPQTGSDQGTHQELSLASMPALPAGTWVSSPASD